MTTPRSCPECGRANPAQAQRCLWCGVPLFDEGSHFEPLRVALNYLHGIERLPDPAPVMLTISEAGISISETMPGSRTVHIALDTLLDASALDASVEADPPRRRWWRRNRAAQTQPHFLLTIRFETESGPASVTFSRDDEAGWQIVKRVAQTIEMLLRRRAPGDIEK